MAERVKMGKYIQLEESDLDRPIYRFTTFARLIEFFRTGEFALAQTSKWDDPFENFIVGMRFKNNKGTLDLALRNAVHGSCWTRKSVSDALWRIYSPDKLSVRIGSTPRLLGTSLDCALAKYPRTKWFIGKVDYLPQKSIVNLASALARLILQDESGTAAARSVLLKRRSFAHEDEVRILVIDRHRRSKGGVLKVKIDPHRVLRSVMIDSRAPREILEMYRTHLKGQLGFRGRISKSTLYDLPDRLVIQLGD
jgi:hypothetical protein